jgi:hypothetical protein
MEQCAHARKEMDEPWVVDTVVLTFHKTCETNGRKPSYAHLW